MRRLLVLSFLPAFVMTPLAQAAPNVGAESGAGAEFVLTTQAGSYQVRLLASIPTAGGSPRLRFHLYQPAGTADTKLYGELPVSSLTTSGAVTTLTTRLGGSSLTVRWEKQSSSAVVEFGEASSDGSNSDGWSVTGQGGTAAVTLGAVRCTTDAVAIGTAVAHDTTDYGSPLAQGLGVSLKGARCAAPVSTPIPILP